jgi:hypothetical protein
MFIPMFIYDPFKGDLVREARRTITCGRLNFLMMCPTN